MLLPARTRGDRSPVADRPGLPPVRSGDSIRAMRPLKRTHCHQGPKGAGQHARVNLTFAAIGRTFRNPVTRAALGLIVALALWAVNPGISTAQTAFPQGGSSSGSLGGTLFSDRPDIFANDGRIKLLVLALNPFGIREGPAATIGEALEKNLSNTAHFDVTGPRQINAWLEGNQDLADLTDCRGIACGVDIGKRIGADFVLVGTLNYEDPVFNLQVRMINISNNLTDHSEDLRFEDETMDEGLFKLANNISRNSLLKGRVLSTSVRGIAISLGQVDGIKIGDHLVIYKNDVPITNLEGQQVDTQRKNVAIVNVLNVNRNSSEAVIIHKTEEPQVSHFVQTYLDPRRQIELIEDTRRELDTGIRLANRLRPLDLTPVLVADTDRQEWAEAVKEAEKDRNFWFTMGLAAGGLTLWTLYDYENDDSGRIQLALTGGATGFATWKWISARGTVNDLMVEGRAKGFIGWNIQPVPTPDGGIGLQLALNF